MVFSTFWIEYRLWRLNPAGYHLTNVLLHIGCCLLIWRILRRFKIPGPLLAATIFAFHPVHVESVAWIAERKDVLSGFFFLAGIYFWDRFLKKGRVLDYCLVALAFFCAITSKTVTCTLPVILIVLTLWQKPSWWRNATLYLSPLFLGGLILGLYTAWWEKARFGAEGELFDLSLIERILLAGRAPWFYLSKIILPVHLFPIYPRWDLDPSVWWQWLFPIMSLALLVMAILCRKWVAGGFTVAVLFFLIQLAPAMGFISHSTMDLSFVADHYQYLASIAPITLIAWLLAVGLDRFRIFSQFPNRTAGVVLLAPLWILSLSYASVFADSESLWTHALKANPDSWAVHNNLGTAYLENERYAAAVPHYQEAYRLNPEFEKPLVNLAIAMKKMGRHEEAVGYYLAALKVSPKSDFAHYHLARFMAEIGNKEKSEEHFRKALEGNPRNIAAHNSLGALLAESGRFDEAIIEFRDVLRINRFHKMAKRNLRKAWIGSGRQLPSESSDLPD